jgi:NADH-quinone oxidoreductase subunit L
MQANLSLILALPFAGALIQALLGRFLARRLVETLACAAVIGAFAAAVAALPGAWGETHIFQLFPWFSVGGLSASMDALYDPLSAIMAVMVTFVSSIIHIHSVGFMRGDESYVRYFCYLNLFVFFMLVITLADNMVFLFLGWEGVGFCSYALIGFWFADAERTLAGRKAFIMTRIGDVGFLIAIALFFAALGVVSISGVSAAAGTLAAGTATTLGLLLLWAAVGKSAQLPLLVWLPDAMAGPTPVSALIHAATMVTAGVYLLMRLFPVLSLSPVAMAAVAGVGALTALFASFTALAQRDIKRVLAWSTISQVGYMFLGIGAGDLTGSMFHLLSHAFFKSLLFMGAGCVIQALHEEHDIFRMGARVRTAMPQVFLLFFAGALALAAAPPASGYFSKGRILLATLGHGGGLYTLYWVIGSLAAILTALYTFRLVFLVFFGDPVFAPKTPDIEPLPPVMITILWPLAVLALGGGLLNLPDGWPGANWLGHALAGIPGAQIEIHGASELAVSVADAGFCAVGFFLAWTVYGPKTAPGRRGPAEPERAAHKLLGSGFGLDALYRVAVVAPYAVLAGFFRRVVDEGVIDALVMGQGTLLARTSRSVRLLATGRASTYLLTLLLGLAAMAALLLVRGNS